MDTLTSLAIISLAALIHSSFQLSVSMLTLLSSHTLGAKIARQRLIRLTGSFLLGALVMTTLVISFLSYLVTSLYSQTIPALLWAISSGLLIGLGFAVWGFYYRRGKGTALWLPREMAQFLTDRTKATSHTAEAFSLGSTSVLAEIVFIIAPASAAALALASLKPELQLWGVALYSSIASLSLFIVYVLVGSGHKLSQIQKWREDNKSFLQFVAGCGLLVLGFYVYVNGVVATVANGGGL